MSTYCDSQGHVSNHFNPERHRRFDALGKKAAYEFWESRGWRGEMFDMEEGVHNWANTDLIFKKGNATIYAEAAVKRSDLWWHVQGGVDVETRKRKYCQFIRPGCSACVVMFEYVELGESGSMVEIGNNMLFIPMECLKAAQDHCGENFKGQGGITSSFRFTMPEHGCHRVRKRCKRGYKQDGEPEDFYRIPLDYCVQFHRANSSEPFRLHKKSTLRINIGETT